MLLCLAGSGASLYRISEVNRLLDSINRSAVSFGRLLAQIQSDSELVQREVERRLGRVTQPESTPAQTKLPVRPLPRWLEEVLGNEFGKAREMIRLSLFEPELEKHWLSFVDRAEIKFKAVAARLKGEAGIPAMLDDPAVRHSLTQDTSELIQLTRVAVQEHERYVRNGFQQAESKVSALKTGLEVLLVVVVSLSLLLLWFGERALRPLVELSMLARGIRDRGLTKEDKDRLPELARMRASGDEVGRLMHEFHAMAVALLEREKTVESQKRRLEDQNRMLREIGGLNDHILKSLKSIFLVIGFDGVIRKGNATAEQWLELEPRLLALVLGTDHRTVLESLRDLRERFLADQIETSGERVGPLFILERAFAGRLMPFWESGELNGVIVDLADVTDELRREEMLRQTEQLALVGRMSAQVAHEIRNPLHSIGLEAELALEEATRGEVTGLKQSLMSIQASVERLNKITENYLKLSRPSRSKHEVVSLPDVLEEVLATYMNECQSLGISVDWVHPAVGRLTILADRELLIQALGNLMRNAMQAVAKRDRPQIRIAVFETETGRAGFRIEDSGPGISDEIRPRLFEPFATTRAEGTGLGLSFVKKVVEDYAGQIDVSSQSRLGGACFEVVFPSTASRLSHVTSEVSR